MKKFLYALIVVFYVGCIAAGIYVGGWLMFGKPILALCAAIDAGKITAVIVGSTIIKAILAAPAGVLVACLPLSIATAIIENI